MRIEQVKIQTGYSAPAVLLTYAETTSPVARSLCGFGYLIGLALIAWVIGQGVVSAVPLIFS